jgi:hypothetical protein
MARGTAKSRERRVNGELVAGFTGFILVENGWGGKCETRGREAGAKRNTGLREGAETMGKCNGFGQKNAGQRPFVPQDKPAVRKAG